MLEHACNDWRDERTEAFQQFRGREARRGKLVRGQFLTRSFIFFQLSYVQGSDGPQLSGVAQAYHPQ